MTRDEIFRRDKTVCELTVEAEMIKINLQKMQKTLSEQQIFCQQIYKDIKLSMFLSKTDPNVCLLFNDGG